PLGFHSTKLILKLGLLRVLRGAGYNRIRGVLQRTFPFFAPVTCLKWHKKAETIQVLVCNHLGLWLFARANATGCEKIWVLVPVGCLATYVTITKYGGDNCS